MREEGTEEVFKTTLGEVVTKISKFEQKGYVQVTTQPSDMQLTLLGHPIDLGLLRSVWHIVSIKNIDELRRLTQGDFKDDIVVGIHYELDREQSFTERVVSQ